MVSEEFSFPKINFSLPNFAISPSLWRVSSLVYPDHALEIEEIKEADVSDQKSSSGSYLKAGEEKTETETETENYCSEEKMDMLWEKYFNEELRKVSPPGVDSTRRRAADSDRSSNEETAEICCAVKMSRNGNRVKILKRIFSMFT